MGEEVDGKSGLPELPIEAENDPEVLRAWLKDSFKQNDRLLRELDGRTPLPQKIGKAKRAADALRRFNVPVASGLFGGVVEHWKPVVASVAGTLVATQLLLIGLSFGDPNTWDYKWPGCHSRHMPMITDTQEPAMPFANVPIGIDGHWIRPPEDTSPTTVAINGQAKQAFFTIHDPCQAQAFSIFGWRILTQNPLDHVTVAMVPVPDGNYTPPAYGSQIKNDIPDSEKMAGGFYQSLDPTHLTPLKPDTKQVGNELTFKNTKTGTGEMIIEPQGQLTPKGKHDTWNMVVTFHAANWPLGDGKVHQEVIGQLTVDTRDISDPTTEGFVEYLSRWGIHEAEKVPNYLIDSADQRVREIEAWFRQFGQYIPAFIKDNWPNLPDQVSEIHLDNYVGQLGRQGDYLIRASQHVAQHGGQGINETAAGWCSDLKVCSSVGGQGDATGQPRHGGLQ